MHPGLVAGVDVGGTKTHVRISRAARRPDGAMLVAGGWGWILGDEATQSWRKRSGKGAV